MKKIFLYIFFIALTPVYSEEIIDLGDLNITREFLKPEFNFELENSMSLKEASLLVIDFELRNIDEEFINKNFKSNLDVKKINDQLLEFEKSIFSSARPSPTSTPEIYQFEAGVLK